jgi:hypothetical protein
MKGRYRTRIRINSAMRSKFKSRAKILLVLRGRRYRNIDFYLILPADLTQEFIHMFGPEAGAVGSQTNADTKKGIPVVFYIMDNFLISWNGISRRGFCLECRLSGCNARDGQQQAHHVGEEQLLFHVKQIGLVIERPVCSNSPAGRKWYNHRNRILLTVTESQSPYSILRLSAGLGYDCVLSLLTHND